MKVGDRLYCYYSGSNYITIGLFYRIIRVDDNKLWISNDRIDDWFYIEDSGLYSGTERAWYYKNYFYSIKELRKVKLDLLKIVCSV